MYDKEIVEFLGGCTWTKVVYRYHRDHYIAYRFYYLYCNAYGEKHVLFQSIFHLNGSILPALAMFWPVWPVKSRQMSIKVAQKSIKVVQKWFH